MGVNDTQVGGQHYQSAYQHWDFVTEVLKCRYLEGCVTKYVTRWRSKNGLEDLRKARHYLSKILSLRDYRPMQRGMVSASVHASIERYCESNSLTVPERAIIGRIALWKSHEDLVMALTELDCIIDTVERTMLR